MEKISDHIFLFRDTCNVYVVRGESSAVLIDFGSGDVLDHLNEIGVEQISDVLMTHHHRDQSQGLARAVEAGICIWVPHQEQDLFAHVDDHWQAREIYMNYNMRQDRFSLLEAVAIAGTLKDYTTPSFAGQTFTIMPTQGHTVGSISLLLDIDGKRWAFTGDLIAAPGKVWMMSATQWTYNGVDGEGASIASLIDLKTRQPDVLLPSHGELMTDPAPAIDLLIERFWQILQLRGTNPRLFEFCVTPYEAITPHLLRHRNSFANCYVLLSESKKALYLDFGYDLVTGGVLGSDRASRRPWLYTIPALKQQFDIEKIDVVIPTHFHDDHVAGINLLHEIEGAQVWAAETFADVLEHPADYDLPCLWYDPIPVDQRLPLETPIQWEEYTITLYPLPGHTLYAVAISFEVDGKKVLVTGDQYQRDDGLDVNYVYPNRFEASDYVKSAALYKRLNPDLILTGHWKPLWVPPDYYGKLEAIGVKLEQLHHDLQPDEPYLGTEGFLARITPYQARAYGGESVEFTVIITNPFNHPAEAIIQMVLPQGWQPVPVNTIQLNARASQEIRLSVCAPAQFHERRVRIAVDVTVDKQRFGQQAEALVSAK
jgi:glyoxylase-like metal-dependent hydrolase (beta-lactamase superfamily II)